MSMEEAKAFVAKLKSDPDFCQRMTQYIHNEGYICTLREVRRAEWEALMGCENKHCKASSNISSSEGHCPYMTELHGYEYWVG